jgi:hypothetical protein
MRNIIEYINSLVLPFDIYTYCKKKRVKIVFLRMVIPTHSWILIIFVIDIHTKYEIEQ